MAKPRIFVSSTYYDLRHVRASLETFIQSLGYEPILSEKGNIAYSPEIPLDESCYREAASADMLVLIIGGRYGAERSESRIEIPRSLDERYESITKMEYESAVSNNVPVWILVDTQVYAEYQTFQKNRNSDAIVYAHVDSVNIFHLLEEILLQRRNNALYTFSRYTDIENWLREQWAGVFRDLLKRTAQSQQLASLSAQVFQLSELNKTLKTYLENLMRTSSTQEHERVIRDETSRLEQIKSLGELMGNSAFSHLVGVYDVSAGTLAQIFEDSETYDDFKRRLREIDGEAADAVGRIA
jgi:hypothetical protein